MNRVFIRYRWFKTNIRPTTTVNALLWKEFVGKIAGRKGIGKGVIKAALEEALECWIMKQEGEDET